MAEDRFYLTVDRERRQPQNDGYLAVISQGSPQHGDEECTVLDVCVVKSMKHAKAWYRRALIERPWETRS